MELRKQGERRKSPRLRGAAAMTGEDLDVLKKSVGGLVELTVVDGEVLVASVHSVSDEHGDVLYDLVSTTMPEKYERHDVQPVYSLEFRHIACVRPAPGQTRRAT